MDQAAFKAANRLVGNASHLPVLETVGGGLSLQSVGENVVAVTGADAPTSPRPRPALAAPRYAAIALADGDTLSLGQPVAGARCYVAVRGGYEVAPVLGSASTDTLAHVGPPALRSGQLLAVLPAPHAVVAELALPGRTAGPGRRSGAGCGAGPAHRLVHARGRGPAGQPALAGHAPVQPRGPAPGRRAGLTRAITSELPSEGTPLGAIQVPASGQPVLFLADHP
jgi:allophanate hydrolase subunit 2